MGWRIIGEGRGSFGGHEEEMERELRRAYEEGFEEGRREGRGGYGERGSYGQGGGYGERGEYDRGGYEYDDAYGERPWRKGYRPLFAVSQAVNRREGAAVPSPILNRKIWTG